MKYLIVLLFLYYSMVGYSHPLHLSITNIDIADTSINVTVRVFEEDIVHQLNIANRIDEDIEYFISQENGIDLINSYFQHNLKIKVDEKIDKMQYENAIWKESFVVVNYSISYSGGGNDFYVENKILLDCYHDQSNLVIISNKGSEKGLQLNIDNWSDSVVF